MPKISSITFHYVLSSLEKHSNVKISEMLEFCNLDKKLLMNQNQYIESNKLSSIFKYCVQKSNDESLALKIGTSSTYHSLGILGYLMLNANTLKEVIEKFDSYQKLISGLFKFKLHKENSYYKLCIYINENPRIPVPSFHAEVHLSAIVSILKQILNEDIKPDYTYFSFKANSYLEEYKKIFGNNTFFEKDENAIYFNSKKLNTKVNNSNIAMLKYFEAQADKILLQRKNNSYFNKVKKEILKTIGEHEINIEFISKRLALNPRTLQYLLKNENKKFRDAFLEVRMHLANHLIQNSKMELSSVSYYLGYSEPSSFFRAYKKFYNKTPRENLS